MPKIDIAKIPVDTVNDLSRSVLAADRWAASASASAMPSGLSQFGVNLTTLKPGAWSSQRHWHRNEDEFVYVLEGEITLCEDHSETVLKPGDAAGLKADSGNGHCLINRTQTGRGLHRGRHPRGRTKPWSIPTSTCALERDKTGMRYLKKTGEPYPPRKA